jgi:hypothetical protein
VSHSHSHRNLNRAARRARREAEARDPERPAPPAPNRALIDRLLPRMIDTRGADRPGDPRAARTVHIWALAALGTEYAVLDPAVLDADLPGSPIVAATQRLMTQLPEHGVWGFGIACWLVGELFSQADSSNAAIPDEVRAAMNSRSLQDRPSAETYCAAMIFDSRGRSYNAIRPLYIPELGAITWQQKTLNRASTDDWIRRFDAGAPSAHVWAAATALNAANRAVLKRLGTGKP